METQIVRVVDHDVRPGVSSDEGEGDDWPAIHEKLLASEILVIATPTWLGRPSSVAQRVLERMDAMLSEEDDDGRPVAYNRVAGVVVTGNEDGAHHVISEISRRPRPTSATRSRDRPGPTGTAARGPGDDYLDSDEGKDWSASTGRAAAGNLVAVARALEANPVGPPAE